MRKGFTLIELLIVVAIIAILAAIAVPNFLEAQVRAKVSRMKTDMRSMSVAIESYTVDYSYPPLGWRATAAHEKNCNSITLSSFRDRVYFGISKLTTPLAYMTSLPVDVFTEKGQSVYADRSGFPPFYDTYGENQWGCKVNKGQNLASIGYTWALYSYGPTRLPKGANSAINIIEPYHGLGPAEDFWIYDPTNGTISVGYVIRTNKGVFPQ